MTKEIEPSSDPCDQMVTVEQVVVFVTSKTVAWHLRRKTSPYDRMAAILGITRDEAKRAVYNWAYGGK